MANKMSSFFHPFLFDCHRTVSAEVVVVSLRSFVFVLRIAQSLIRQRPTERKPNYFSSFFCFTIRCRAFVTLFLLLRHPRGYCYCHCQLLLLHERWHRIPCCNFSALFEWEILHFYCRRINYLVSFLCAIHFIFACDIRMRARRNIRRRPVSQTLGSLCMASASGSLLDYCGFRSRFFFHNLTI